MGDFKNTTILIVDDEDDLREMLAIEFRRLGCQILSAASGRQAINIIQQKMIDLVICDVRIPEKGEVDIMDILGKLDGAAPPFIFITAYDSYLSEEAALDLGAQDLFIKPFALKPLLARVQKALKPVMEKWCTPPGIIPHNELVHHFPDLKTAEEANFVRMGKGGIAVRSGEYIVQKGGGVALNLSFEKGPIRFLQGTARVRWIHPGMSSTDYIYGLEFDYLEQNTHESVCRWVEHLQNRAFIPNL